jgi:hypothetical protein
MRLTSWLTAARATRQVAGAAAVLLTTMLLGTGDTAGAAASAAPTPRRSVAAPTHVFDAFDNGRIDGWVAKDEGTIDGPSNWRAVRGKLRDNSNLYGGRTGAAAISKPGPTTTTPCGC